MKSDDVGMIEGGDRLGLAFETDAPRPSWATLSGSTLRATRRFRRVSSAA
jgi:hypothetical protein